ncbi:helix-turn-helix domain-containing protein [Microvirga sp. 2TAF3]|uniref:helix-turn-helix domain-containing protein n=1 Tax=Microvirga sp. 2TAF3 TaxID=3233014 RepID=UPI003F964099
MSTIPTYALYGEYKDDPGADWVHCETIQSRSRLHNYVIQPHRHERLFQILHLASGRAEIVVDGRHTMLDAPCIVALPPMVVHGYTFSPDVGGTVLTLFERRLASILDAAEDIEATFQSVQIVPLARHPEIAQTLAADMAHLAAEFAGRASGRLAMIEARLALILIALHRLQGAGRQASPEAHARAFHHVMRFRQLVDQEFRSHKPIEIYARRLGLTATHLNRICREHLGETALGIVHQRIVLEAKRYLTFTSLSAKEVALALAFDDPSYFTRFFKRETGLSPMAFRALQK